MQELDKALGIAIPETQVEAILQAYKLQLEAWDLVMPMSQPLVLDFGLGRFKKEGLVEAWICNEVTAGYCGKYLFLFDGQTCPMHRHRHKTETFHIVKGTVDLHLDGKEHRMREGDTLLVEAWKPHRLTGVGSTLILELSTPCQIEDNYFENPDIPIGGNYGGEAL